MDGSLSFNTNSLQTYNPATRVGIITNVIDHTDPPDQNAQLYGIADANKSAIPNITYPSKKITISGFIKGSSQTDLDTRIDTFKGYFNGKDKNLDITYGGATRRYTATKTAMSIKRGDKTLTAAFQVEFTCTQPFGRETASTSIINQSALTTASYNATPTIAGSAPVQLPIITITLTALTGTGDYVQISNDNNNQQILLYGLGLTAGAVIVIDCVERTVTVNGNPVEYYGSFLELEPGAQSLTYTDGFTTRTVNLQAVYYKRYM